MSMKSWSALLGCIIVVAAAATLAAQAPVLANLEAPYAALQNPTPIHLAGNSYGVGMVAYGPAGTPLVLTGDDLGETGVVKFVSYKNGAVDTNAPAVTAPVTMWTPTIVILKVPSGATSGLVVVTNSTGTSNGLPFIVTSGTYLNSCPALPATIQLQITTAELDDGMVNNSYSFALQATGGTGTYTWSIVSGTLPTGLSLNASTGVISGTPSTDGTIQLTIQVADSGSQRQTNVSVLSLTIDTAAQAASDMPLYSFSIASGSSSGYDAVGNVVSYTDSVTGTWNMMTSSGASGYDSLNRLALATQTPVNGQPQYFCWQYDSFGNRKQQFISSAAFASGSGGATACTAQQGPNVSLATLWNSYTDASNVDPGTNRILSSNTSGVAANLTYDNAGNVTDDGNNTYVYDGEGRICAVRHEAISGWAIMTQYLYDASGARVAKGTITNWSAGCDTTQNGFAAQTVFVLGPSGEQLTEITKVSGTWQWQHTNVMAGSLSATYTNDNVASAAGSVYFHLSDWLGTRRQQTDYAGNPVEVFSSLPYGDQLDFDVDASAPDGVADATELHFTGKERDTESGNDYFGARYDSSSMGRFLSPDFGGPVPNMPDAVPWADYENPQSLNLYSYGFNNPLSNTDDDGHDVNVCDNDGHCHEMTNDQYKAAQQAGNGGLNVPTLDQVGMNGNGSGQFNSTAITDANGNTVGTATYVSDGPTDYYANRNGLNTLATASATVGSVKGVAAFYGASALGALAVYGSGVLAGEELTTLGDIMTTPSAGQTSQAEMVLEQSGKKGVEKAIRTLEKRILQHEEKIQQFRQAGGFTSKAESEIQNFQSLIRAYQSVLK